MSDRTVVFHRHRARLYGISYRMLGSRADAEDMVQDAWLRWQQADIERVQTPQAWLVTTITRLCIDRLRAVRSEREAYIGPWLPEPLVGEASPPADQRAELASDLSIAFLVVLERLSPEERAAFLLHEVFDCEYAEIADILGKNKAACRQIVHRSRERVRRERPRFVVSEAARVRLLDRFFAALQAEDHDALLALFAEDVTWTSDGGGKAKAARKIVRGAELVSRFALGIWRAGLSGLSRGPITINGEAGLLISRDGLPVSAFSIDTDGMRILGVYAVLNPDKLKGIVAIEDETK